ncbi:hypothetical protein ACIQ1D_21320 [Lysinibacillus xylanilyticus]|uniref:hypothetical protein n=1 Tax=Lysinibacillus xylanilyticus TaxID=582475 RepID=UPI00380B37A6
MSKSMTSAAGFGPTDVFCAKAKRQRHDVGHSVVATGRGVLRLVSSISVGVGTPTEKEPHPHSSCHLQRWEPSLNEDN